MDVDYRGYDIHGVVHYVVSSVYDDFYLMCYFEGLVPRTKIDEVHKSNDTVTCLVCITLGTP